MSTTIKIEGENEYLRPNEAMKILRCKSHRILWKRLEELNVDYKRVNPRVVLISKTSLERAINN
jgi:hypothetical protein